MAKEAKEANISGTGSGGCKTWGVFAAAISAVTTASRWVPTVSVTVRSALADLRTAAASAKSSAATVNGTCAPKRQAKRRTPGLRLTHASLSVASNCV